jgi:hypothetical protein
VSFPCFLPSLRLFSLTFITPTVLVVLLGYYARFEMGNGITYDEIWARCELFGDEEMPSYEHRNWKQGASSPGFPLSPIALPLSTACRSSRCCSSRVDPLSCLPSPRPLSQTSTDETPFSWLSLTTNKQSRMQGIEGLAASTTSALVVPFYNRRSSFLVPSPSLSDAFHSYNPCRCNI